MNVSKPSSIEEPAVLEMESVMVSSVRIVVAEVGLLARAGDHELGCRDGPAQQVLDELVEERRGRAWLTLGRVGFASGGHQVGASKFIRIARSAAVSWAVRK